MAEAWRMGGYEAVCANFVWQVPDRYSIAWDICGRWAASEPDRVALVEVDDEGLRIPWRYRDLDQASARLANVLVEDAGLETGDRCALLLPQSAYTAIGHVALSRIGAVAVPLFALFGEEALAFRLQNSGAKVLIATSELAQRVDGIRDRCPQPLKVYVTDSEARPSATDVLSDVLERTSSECPYMSLPADHPAFLSYTSGTTGPPKGALHAKRVLLGHLPGVQLPHEWLPQEGDRMWTPADWAWMGGLTNVMMPALRLGVPLVAYRQRHFDPELALAMMRREEIRNVFLPPTALRMIRDASPAGDGVQLRSLASGGESLGVETLEWGRESFGLTINEFYGQTECNLVVGNCASLFDPMPGSAGRSLPGHEVAVLDDSGNVLLPGEAGELAVRSPDPAMFLGYWKRPDATRDKFAGPWMRTGDIAEISDSGYVRFVARTDDIITSSGYRIGPTETEDCLGGHPEVAMAGVVGIPDPVRTEAVTAFVVRAADRVSSPDDLAATLKERVRQRLGAHLAPRRVVYLDSLPMTTTGKILRRSLRNWTPEDADFTRD